MPATKWLRSLTTVGFPLRNYKSTTRHMNFLLCSSTFSPPMQLETKLSFLLNQIVLTYSGGYMSKVHLAWSQDTAAPGKRYVPGQRSLLMAARLNPPHDLIRCLCGTKGIRGLFFLGVMVSTWHHCLKDWALTNI